ncbi:DUF7287 family protein [Natronobiforma cellulositropha]|uniref:DUF7287 family protein n=1 Tax=Natronobiforma cellulositropha TaxID=1679076 RepID=UPI0021D5BE39|nr:hypothetical protein [Natronobiforma cellulositropha]
MTRERPRKRTVSISLRGRGQTTQDFVVGIGVFLLAIAFVFSYVPSLITPYASAYGGGESAQADRIAATLVDDLAENPARPNHVNGSALVDLTENDSFDLAGDLGLRATDSVAVDRLNVSLERVNQSLSRDDRRIVAGGDPYTGQDAASSARIVTVDMRDVDGSDLSLDGEPIHDVCEPSCRLVVRVW